MKLFARMIAVLLIACTLISMCACGKDGKDKETTDAVDSTQKVDKDTTNNEETTGEDTTGEDTTAEDTTAEDTTAEDTTAADTTKPPVQTTKPVQTTPVTTPATDDNKLGKGSKADPYLEIPVVGTGSMSVTTVSIPAGKTMFYGIYRVGGMVLTINNANAYVICSGKRYDAKNGVLSFVVPSALASDSISFEIGNKGSSAASFTLVFTNLVGTQANPAIIKTLSMSSQNKISLAEGDSDGYNYKYIAEKTGTLRLYMTATKASVLTVTNNRNSAQRSTSSDILTDENGASYVEIEVNAGDELIIIVGVERKGRNYPATDITWYGKYN